MLGHDANVLGESAPETDQLQEAETATANCTQQTASKLSPVVFGGFTFGISGFLLVFSMVSISVQTCFKGTGGFFYVFNEHV